MTKYVSTSVFGYEWDGVVNPIQGISEQSYGQEVIEVKSVTPTGVPVVHKLPGVPQVSGEITMTRAMDEDTGFRDWIQQCVENNDIEGARKNIAVVYMDAQKNVMGRLHLKGAIPETWSGPALSADGSGVATEQLKLHYEDSQFESAL